MADSDYPTLAYDGKLAITEKALDELCIAHEYTTHALKFLANSVADAHFSGSELDLLGLEFLLLCVQRKNDETASLLTNSVGKVTL